MRPSRSIQGHRPASTLAAGAMLVLFVAGAASALPRGYKEDFNGCATQSPDAADRDRCCSETGTQCKQQCDKDFPLDTRVLDNVDCAFRCDIATDNCKRGVTVRQTLPWPGASSLEIEGLEARDDRVVPDRGLMLVPSRGTLLLDLIDEDAGDVCLALAISCRCPAGTSARGQECRAWLDGRETACRICARGAADATCRPCPDCRPEVLSAQACSAPERSKPVERPGRPATGRPSRRLEQSSR
jgi:hypothetical protein